MFRSYLRLALFALGLLVGVQVPGFIDDYSKRVEAHRLESEQSLRGFRETARRFFDGDLQALVGHYRASSDAVMQSDAQSVAYLVERAELLENEWQAMQGPWYRQIWHLGTAADSTLLKETYGAYRYQVLLAPEAIAWGIVSALLLAWLVEGLLVLLSMPFVGRRRRTAPERHWR
ncbi:DUF2937 family protein [Phytopseudomonas dryadis]|uniref:DUF2937 domain-containing protein n=1 Tax=Phytopseudomonas dryadis TaxID=2487520 RepID=A0A4Q9R4Q1_9GAMM|nr:MULTISPECIES: DUF2937 family protein [Pseudomonas]TBU93405.1 DUF2937 domain-containing protein [Pseudomonas dryadis]TBV07087.1 DUF2937 domain-containing protein [Pseudomonas dryadis]TBV19520.1 DUF2937 domain-containing protein [Pseudomonas sp. FRB 230]